MNTVLDSINQCLVSEGFFSVSIIFGICLFATYVLSKAYTKVLYILMMLFLVVGRVCNYYINVDSLEMQRKGNICLIVAIMILFYGLSAVTVRVHRKDIQDVGSKVSAATGMMNMYALGLVCILNGIYRMRFRWCLMSIVTLLTVSACGSRWLRLWTDES